MKKFNEQVEQKEQTAEEWLENDQAAEGNEQTTKSNKQTAEEWLEDDQSEDDEQSSGKEWPKFVRILIIIHKFVLIAAIVVIVLIALIKFCGKANADAVLNGKIYNSYVIFAETQSGSLMYVPINEEEAVMETSSDAGEGLYLWLETGQTVTITDDVMVTKQVNLYNMLKAVISKSKLMDVKVKLSNINVLSHDETYIFYVNGVENIFDLMTKNWGLSEGQATGSLTCYDELLSKDMSMELIIKNQDENTYFKLNLFVDNVGYCIYNGRFLKQEQDHLPQFEVDLYNLNGINTLQRDQQRVDAYAEKAIEYFYKLSTFLIIEDFEQTSNAE